MRMTRKQIAIMGMVLAVQRQALKYQDDLPVNVQDAIEDFSDALRREFDEAG